MMLTVYIAQGEIYGVATNALAADRAAFTEWCINDEMATKIVSAGNEGGKATDVLRAYWDKHINCDTCIDCVKIDVAKECTVEIDSPSNATHPNGIGLWC